MCIYLIYFSFLPSFALQLIYVMTPKGTWGCGYYLGKNISNVNGLHFTGFHCASQMFSCNGHTWSARTECSQSVNGLFFTSFTPMSKWSLSLRSQTAKLKSVKTSEDQVAIGSQAMPTYRLLHCVIVSNKFFEEKSQLKIH